MLIPIFLLAIGGVNANAANQAKPQPAEASREVVPVAPASESGSGVVHRWLALGPVARDHPIDDPTSLLSDPAVGKQVKLPSGEVLTWRNLETDSDGIARLGKFCLTELTAQGELPPGEISQDKIVYLACRLENAEHSVQRYYVGADDGARGWVDGRLVLDSQHPGWYDEHEFSFSVDFTQRGSRQLLLEVHNWTGSFLASARSGYRIHGRAVKVDGYTPVAGALLACHQSSVDPLAEGLATKQRVVPVVTDSAGRFTIEAVPYASEFGFSLGRRTLEVRQQQRAKNGDIQDLLLTVPSPQTASPHIRQIAVENLNISAMIEDEDGILLLADNGGKSMYCYDGAAVFRHPNRLLERFTTGSIERLLIDKRGALWIATLGDGLYRVDGQQIRHWSTELLGQKPTMLFGDEQHVWCHFISPGSNGKTFRIALDNEQISQVTWADEERVMRLNDMVRMPDGKLLVATQFGIAQVEGERISVLTDHREGVLAMAASPAGGIWYADSMLRYREEQDLLVYPWLPRTATPEEIELECTPKGVLWALASGTLYVIGNDSMHQIQLPDVHSDLYSMVISQSSAAYIAIEGVGVYEAVLPQAHTIDHRDGLYNQELKFISRMGDEMLLSAGLQPVVFRHGEVHPVDVSDLIEDDRGIAGRNPGFKVVSLVGTPAGALLAFDNLAYGTGYSRRSTVPPFLKLPGVAWKSLDEVIDRPDGAEVYRFCQTLRDGRAVIGLISTMRVVDGEQVEPFVPFGEDMAINAILETEEGLLGVRPRGDVVIRTSQGALRNLPLVPSLIDAKWNQSKSPFATCIFESQGIVYVGTNDGLFVVDISQGLVKRHSSPILKQSIVGGVQMTHGRDGFWVAGRAGEWFGANADGVVVPGAAFIDSPEINGVSAGADGTLWLATQKGATLYEPSTHSPTITNVTCQQDGKEVERLAGGSLKLVAKQATTFTLAAIDESRTLLFRYRLDGQSWIDVGIGRAVDFTTRFETEGSRVLEFVAIDPDMNQSRIVSMTISAAIPFWQRTTVQWATIGLTVFSLVMALVLLLMNSAAKSERQRTKEALWKEEANARAIAEQASNEREALLARVCHDLRNPATVVTLCSEILGGKVDDDSRKAAGKMLRSSAESINYLTDQLLSYMKSQRLEVASTSGEQWLAEVEEVFQRIVNTTALRYRSQEVEFHTSIDAAAPPWLQLYPEMLVELLNNLIDNAFRHTRRGSVAMNYRAAADGMLLLEVHDTGAGMTPKVLERVFDPFSKGHQEAANCGLGMSIVKNLVDRLGGQVQVQSRLGHGTHVTISLPASLGLAAPPEHHITEPSAAQHDAGNQCRLEADGPVADQLKTLCREMADHKRRIVIVDDEPAIAESIAYGFRLLGCEVLACSEDVEIEAIAQWQPDLLFTDLKMPKRDGFQLAQQVREALGQSAPTLIAFSSSFSSLESVKDNDVFDACFEKSVAIKTLLDYSS